MNADHAQALAETLHDGQHDPGGAALIDHIRRIAAAIQREARVVAWLHEALEHTSSSEEELLAEGLTHDELRALRLLTRHRNSHSNTRYLAHIERIARARGPRASIAQNVKRADLADRTLNPPAPRDLWSRAARLAGPRADGRAPNATRAPSP